MFLTYLAIGDSYGASFEFNTLKFIKKNNHVKDYCLRDGGDPELFGKYTDDTQMTIALAEHIINRKSFDLTKIAFSFADTYHRDPHQGYSKRILNAFDKCKNSGAKMGSVFFNNCQTTTLVHSNGSAMRAIPLCVLPSEGHVIRATQIQSLITHCSHDASMAAQIIAITAHYFYYRKHEGDLSYPKYQLYMQSLNLKTYLDICTAKFVDHYTEHSTIPCDGEITVGAVIYLLFNCTSINQILKTSIDFSGDVDSVAALACSIGTLKDDIDTKINSNLINNLENGKYGRDHLMYLETKLEELYPRL